MTIDYYMLFRTHEMLVLIHPHCPSVLESYPAFDLHYMSGRMYYRRSRDARTVHVLGTLTGETTTVDLPAGVAPFSVLQSGTGQRTTISLCYCLEPEVVIFHVYYLN